MWLSLRLKHSRIGFDVSRSHAFLSHNRLFFSLRANFSSLDGVPHEHLFIPILMRCVSWTALEFMLIGFAGKCEKFL